MNARLICVLQVYLSQRWALPVIGLATVFWGAIVFSISHTSETPPIMICNAVGLPVMGVAFWVTSVAKWQFVNPRARLLPGFAAAHGAVIVGWAGLGMVLLPLVFGLAVPRISPLAAVAYGVSCGALFVWAMHTAKPWLTLLGLVVYFSPAAGLTRPFWTGSSAMLVFYRLAVILAGATGVALWLRELVRLTEESEAYVIPTHAQAGKASRMEKSEARRNVALQLSRSKLAGQIVDWWTNRFIGRRARTTAERWALLPFGHSGVPAWIRCLWLMALMLAVIGINIVLTTSFVGGIIRIAVPAALIFTFLSPAMTMQLLAMRRPRMQSELLLPMTRRQYVDGLFRAVAVESVQFFVVAMGVFGVLIAGLEPELLATHELLGGLIALVVGQVAAFGLAMLTALIESGVKRTLLFLVGLYVVAGLLAAAVALDVYVGAGFAGGAAALMLLAAVLLIRWSHRLWLRAELG